MRRAKLLFLCPCTPDQYGTGWEQRAFSFLAAYSKFADVALWFQPTPDNPNLIRTSTIASVCQSATAFVPQQIISDMNGYKAMFQEALSSSEYVHVFRFPDFLTILRHPRILWDLDELPWKLKTLAQENTDLARQTLDLAWQKYAPLWLKCKLVFSSSSLEQPKGMGPVKVIPNTCAPGGNLSPRIKSDTLLFVGNMNYPPNADAVDFFARDVLPLLPDSIRFRVVGRSAQEKALKSRLQQIALNKRVEFYYDVASCDEHYADVKATIAPIQLGGGTRIKIIEAFARHSAVVSTRKGCEGLSVAEGRELLLADAPAEFAKACQLLLQDSELRRTLSEQAYTYFLNNHTQETVDRVLRSSMIEASLLN